MSFSFKEHEKKHPVAVIGILNLSADSFYQASRCRTGDQALEMAERFVSEGADILDVGAESSRPGSKPIPEEAELEKLLPVVTALTQRFNVPVCVDTYKPAVAEKVLHAGASIINDITALHRHPETAKIVARHEAGIILMHMRGEPETMQNNPHYEDLLGEVFGYLKRSLEIAEAAGISSDRIALDPGIGFGKTTDHNLALVAQLDRWRVLEKTIVLGVSRKSVIGNVLDLSVEERLEGSLAAGLYGVMKGANALRVHDVRATVLAVKMIQAIKKFERNE